MSNKGLKSRRPGQEHDPYTYIELYESVSDGFLVALDGKKIIGFV